jgi:hypothetical protein
LRANSGKGAIGNYEMRNPRPKRDTLSLEEATYGKIKEQKITIKESAPLESTWT